MDQNVLYSVISYGLATISRSFVSMQGCQNCDYEMQPSSRSQRRGGGGGGGGCHTSAASSFLAKQQFWFDKTDENHDDSPHQCGLIEAKCGANLEKCRAKPILATSRSQSNSMIKMMMNMVIMDGGGCQ